MPLSTAARALVSSVLATGLALPGGVAAAAPWQGAVGGVTAMVPTGEPETGDVPVQAVPGGVAAAAVRRSDGSVSSRPLVGGTAAAVPAGRVAEPAGDPAVGAVTQDGAGSPVAAHPGVPAERAGLPRHLLSTGATGAWAVGQRGRGVGIAFLDTGVAPVPDLSGRLVYGPDLSGEASASDTYGHGTQMAGLAAGNGHSSGGVHSGVAPEATVVAVKVAGRDGSVQMSAVLRGLQWVSEHAERYGIRVLNLSWGTPGTPDSGVDPLDEAVERLWAQGVVVVVGAGNAGRDRVMQPADNPTVLTVGALDDQGDDEPGNDVVPDWSSRGVTAGGSVKPDLVAPGRSVIGVRAPGSTVEMQNPQGLVGGAYIKGSGTSQAAAITSGLVALLLAERPELTPDQVKRLLVGTAVPLPGVGVASAAPGRVTLDGALTAAPAAEPARDEPLSLLRAPAPSGTSDSGACSWTGSSWTGSSWTGSSWTGSSWTGSSWTGSSWTGSSWTGSSWTGSSWTGSSWTSAGWGSGLAAVAR